ncbi:MAG: uroporphyrinogen decarboxylase family protein [Candidatus Bathyarchaeia archaeon]
MLDYLRRPSLSWRENFLRAIEFKRPEFIPCRVSISWPVWNVYREKLEDLASAHPLIFRGFKRGSIEYCSEPRILKSNRTFTDPFGCVWAFPIQGLQGQVVKHSLNNWSLLRNFQLPDPEDGLPVEGGGLVPWNQVYEGLERAREADEPLIGGMPHGFFFQRLYYLRGFTNLMEDFIRKPTQLYELIDMLTEYNLALVRRLLAFRNLDVISFGDDLGMQDRMPISPRVFREFIYPSYFKIFSQVREAGVHAYLHSDGHVVEVVDQLIESGVDILNIQDIVNGVDTIAKLCKGEVCVDLDIDRQLVVPFGTAEDVKKHVCHAVKTLSLKEGGLMLIAGIYPPTPLENIKALVEAMEEFMWL